MKKFLALLLALTMVLSMAACSSSTPAATTAATTAPAETTAATEAAADVYTGPDWAAIDAMDYDDASDALYDWNLGEFNEYYQDAKSEITDLNLRMAKMAMADAKLMDRIQVFHQYCVTSVPSFVQRACVTALETDTSDVVEIFRRRRDYVYQRLVDMGLDVEKPEGAFYMFVDIRKFGMDSNTFCTRMLKEGLVGVIPGIHFGTEGFMRLSYCYSDADLKEGLDRIEKFIKSL